jgi:hypothetical protein
MRISTSFTALATLTATVVSVIASPNLNIASPIDFFTNVASRALSQELNLNLTQIQIYPTNQYTPAVHRLLQVAANVYDATTTNLYPSVFRPVFTSDGTNVFISGYEQVISVSDATDSPLALPVDAASLPIGISTNVNVYGVPWIIGAKKGFPNFNEFSMENVMWIERKLQIARPSINAAQNLWQTNQMYVMSISNSVGVECWNSYSANYIPLGGLNITVRDTLSTTLSNLTAGTIQPIAGTIQPTIYAINNTVTPAFWPGTVQPWTNNTPNSNSFIMPLNTTVPFFTNEVCVSPTGSFVFQSTLGSNWNTGIFPLPQFCLLTTNQLQVFMLDGTNVIDYVQFSGPESGANLNSFIADFDTNNPNAGLWNTNLSNGGIPNGINNQILYSENPQLNRFVLTANDDRTWVNPPGSTVGQEIASFNAFFSPNHIGSGTDPTTGVHYRATNLDLIVQVPFTPSRYVYGYTSWQANDPLVHYLASDLNYSGFEQSGLGTGWHQWNNSTTNIPANNLGLLNDRYQPWGINTQMRQVAGVDANAFNLTFKDPLVDSSDDWDFPDGQMTNLDWIGQVHRGTPWQTIYLKTSNVLNENSASGNIGTNTWVAWTGNANLSDAVNTTPVQDWHLASLLVSLLNTNDFRSLLSVNNSNSNAWLVLLDGLTAWTNSSADDQISSNYFFDGVPQFDAITISSNSPQASILANAIQSARAGQPNQFFHDVGDILATPQLTEQSPFLNLNDSVQQEYGISDEAYEIIPAQLLPLLRVDSVGSAGLANGQMFVQFTGYDNHAYAIEVSSNLVDWVSVSTNYPVNGTFSITNTTISKVNLQFYRSVLLQ